MMLHFHEQQIIGQRESQQDCIGQMSLSPQSRLFILADGMGGHEAGEIASQTVVQQFAHYFTQNSHHESMSVSLLNALHVANDALQKLVNDNPQWAGMGTTLLAVCVHENGQFDYISVGDSPLYHLVSGSLKRINANHAFAEILAQQVARGEISPEVAAQHPKRHAITSALTGNPIPHIDQNTGNLKTGERLLLASDGVQTLADDKILLWVAHSPVLIAMADLFNAIVAQQEPHQDNASAILIEYGYCSFATRALDSRPTLPPEITELREDWQAISPISQPEHQHVVPLKSLLLGGVMALLLSLVGLLMVWAGGSADKTSPNNNITVLVASEPVVVAASDSNLILLSASEIAQMETQNVNETMAVSEVLQAASAVSTVVEK